ncbi:MAG: FABP family protein [Ignavibacteria bacterium]|nr:FABP family protein [Ignavibacteria bacterium]
MKIEELLFLEGRWEGSGTAQYPLISEVSYSEILNFEYDKTKGFIFYIQQTKFKIPGKENDTLHHESGFIKQTESGNIELSNSQNNGRVEVLYLDNLQISEQNTRIVFESKLFGNDPKMIKTLREYNLTGSNMFYEMKMATSSNQVLSTHLKSELTKKGN